MAIAITIPRLGWNMEEGVFVGWLKQRRRGQCAPASRSSSSRATRRPRRSRRSTAGILEGRRPTAPAAGTTVRVGAVIGFLLGSGETEALPGPSRVTRPSRDPPSPATGGPSPVERRPFRPAPQLSPGAPVCARARHRVDEAHGQRKLRSRSQGRRARGRRGREPAKSRLTAPPPRPGSRSRSLRPMAGAVPASRATRARSRRR